jgi:hypothetical protein
MSSALDSLVLDLVEWIAREPRPYPVVMDAWRTSCPRLTVWEDAIDRGFVECRLREGQDTIVVVTDAGLAALGAGRPPKAPQRTPATSRVIA